MNLEDGAPKNRVVIIAISIALLFAFYFLPASFTGFAVYSVEEHTADGENTTFNNATMQLGNYLDTQVNDGSSQTLAEVQNGSYYILKWNYDFNTSYNDTQPSQIVVISDTRTPDEMMNISIYDFFSSTWIVINETVVNSNFHTQITTLSWSTMNLTNLVSPTGQIKILFEDSDKTEEDFSTLRIDYLAINVTVSPLYDLLFNITNSTGDVVSYGENFTRGESELNASALWNASGVNASYVWLNASGTVNEFRFNHTDSNDNWTNHTFDFSNYTLFPCGGNVSVRLKAYDDFFQQNYTAGIRYFYLWSNASIGNITINESIYDENTTIANSTTFEISCLVTDYFSNESVPGHNVSFFVDNIFRGWALSNSTGWSSYTYTDTSTGSDSYDVRCNITDDSGVYYYQGPSNSSNETVYVVGDGDKPYFIENWFEYQGQRLANNSIGSYHESGFYRNITVVANVSDYTSYVSSVIAKVTFSTGAVEVNHSMTQGQQGLWRFTFDDSGPWKSLNDSLTFYFYYRDVGGNLNGTNVPGPGGSLQINNTMYINLTDWESDVLYNRGENLSFSAYGIHGFLYEDANWSLQVLKYGSSSNESDSYEGATYYNYTVNASASPGNWTVWVNSSQMGNNGSSVLVFNVTDVLNPYLDSPFENKVYQPSNDISSDIVVRVNYTRDDPVTWNLTVNLTCEQGTFTLLRSGNNYMLNASDHCYAYGDWGKTFYLTVNVTCPHNNTAPEVTRALKTDTEDDGNGGSPGGSSSSSVVPPVCNCTEYEDVDCGASDCLDSEMYQERVCTPAGCSQESRCIGMPKCTDLKNFNITSSTDVVEITQGKNATAIFEVENTGNREFELEINLAYDCCEFFPRFDKFELGEKTQVTVPIIVHAPLTQEPGEYVLTVKFKEKDFEKMQSIRILVNENEMLGELQDLETLMGELMNEIENLKGLDIDVTGLERRIEELGISIERANSNILTDNIESFDSYFKEAREVFDSINEVIFPARLQGFAYKSMYNLIAAFVLLILMIYILTEVIRPPFTLKRRLDSLRKMVDEQKEVRKKAERDRMRRKIDDTTCRDIEEKSLAEETKLNTRIRETEKEIELLDSRFSPKGIISWMLAGPRKLFRRKPKASKAPERKEKMSSKMADVQRKLIERQKKQESES